MGASDCPVCDAERGAGVMELSELRVSGGVQCGGGSAHREGGEGEGEGASNGREGAALNGAETVSIGAAASTAVRDEPHPPKAVMEGGRLQSPTLMLSPSLVVEPPPPGEASIGAPESPAPTRREDSGGDEPPLHV